MSQQAQAANRGPTAQYVTFRLMDEIYAISVLKVREVLRVSEIAPVPGAAEYVLGIINLRGNVVTVIDARGRMGLVPKASDDASRVVIIEEGDQVVGILVDSVAEVIELADSDIEPAPNVGNDDSSRYIKGVASRDGVLTIVADVDKLLSEDEWAEIATG